MTNEEAPTDQPGLREQAITRLRKKSELRAHLLAYVLVNRVPVDDLGNDRVRLLLAGVPACRLGHRPGLRRLECLLEAVLRDRIRHEMERIR